jgi:hypothetical protein
MGEALAAPTLGQAGNLVDPDTAGHTFSILGRTRRSDRNQIARSPRTRRRADRRIGLAYQFAE